MLAPGEKKVNLRKLHKRKVWFKKNPHIYAMYMYLLINKREKSEILEAIMSHVYSWL